MPLLQGLRLFIDLDGAGQGKGSLLYHLTCIIETGGGLIVDHIADATHAVLRHQQQQAYQAALNIGTVSVVPPEWVILSATQQQLQAERAGILQGPGIPSMAEHVREITLSGITGLDRAMTRYKVECTGCFYTAAMRLNTTTHVISTAEACHTPSEKITAAMQHGIAVVSGEWLDHCLEAWQYVPVEPYMLIPQPHPPPGAQAGEPGEPPAHFNTAAVEQAGAFDPAVLQQQQQQQQQQQAAGQQQQQQPAGQQQQQALVPGFVSQQQGTTQQQYSQRSDGVIPATLENLASLQPSRPAPHSPAAAAGTVAPTSAAAAEAAAGVPVSEGTEAQQALAASTDEAGFDAAAAQYGHDDSAAAAAAMGEDGGGVDGGEMSQDVTEEPTQEPEDFEDTAGMEGEVGSHLHSPNAAAGATAAVPDAATEAAAAVVDSHAAAGVAADAVRLRPASTEPLDPTEVLEGDAAAMEDDGEPDVTSQATPLKQHAAQQQLQELQQDAAQLDDDEVVQGQHQKEPQQQSELQQQEEEQQQHEEQEQLGEERHWEGEDDGQGDLEALQQPHKPQLELGGAAAAGVAAAPAGPDEADETEQPDAASTPRLLSVDVLGAEAGLTAAPGAAAASHESPDYVLDADEAGAQHMQQDLGQHETPQQQQQQEKVEVQEEVHAGADAAAMAGDDPGVGVPSLVFNMGTLANTSQGVLRADRFVDELIGDLAFPTDSESPVPKPTAHAPRPSRLQQQQQQQPAVAEAAGGGSMHDVAAATAAPSGGGSGGAASGRSSRSLGASGFKVAGLSRRRASAVTPAAAAAPGVVLAEAAASGPVSDLAAGEVEPAEGDDAPAAFTTIVPDPAADQTAAADDAGGRGRRTRARAASASPRLARGRTAAGAAAAATPDAAGGDAARQGSVPQQQTALAAQLLNGAAHSDKQSAATPEQQALDHAAQDAAGADPGTEQAEEQQEQPKAKSRRSAGVRAGTASKATPKLVAARWQRLQQQQTEQEPAAAKEQEQPHKTGRQRQQKQKQQRKQREAAGDSQDVEAAGPADDAGGADEVDALLDEYLQVQDDAALPDEPPPPAAAAAAAADVQPAKRRGSAAAKRPAATTTAAGKRKRAAGHAIEQEGADEEQSPEAGAAVAARSSRKRRKSAAPAAAATPSISREIDAAAGNDAVPEVSEEDHSPDVDAVGTARTKGRGQAARRAASAAGAALGGRAASKRQQQQQPDEADGHDDQEATLSGQQQDEQEDQEQAEIKPTRSRKQGRAAAKATSKQQQQQQQDTRAAPSELDVQSKRGRKRGMQQHADTAEGAAGGAAGDAHTRQVSADEGAVLQPGSKRRTRAEQQQQQQEEVEGMSEQEEIPRPKRQRQQGLRQVQQSASHPVSPEPSTSDDEAHTEPPQPQPARRATAAKRLGQHSKAAATKQPKTGPRAKRSGTATAAAAAEPALPAAEPPASADTSPAVAGVTAPVVALSGMHSDERQRHAATLRRLRVRCLPTSHDWQVGTTHIVQPELKRGEKSLAGMAAGAWLVKQQWLVQSGAAGRLLDPEPYELEACETATGSIAEGAPMHWRVRRQALAAAADQPDAAFDPAGSYGAFAGLRVVFYGSSDAPSFASLARMLKAGGGQVLRKVPPYTSLLPAAAGGVKAGRAKAGRKARSSSGAAATGSQGSGAANLAVIGPDKSSDDSVVCSLREAGVPCASPAYLVDWLAQPWLSLEQHYLFADQAAQSGELQQLEAARGAEGQGQQQSASF